MRNKPKIGDRVVVRVDNTKDWLWLRGSNQYRAVHGLHTDYEGVVVRNDLLDPPNTLSMTTGQVRFPIRTIELSSVIGWWEHRKNQRHTVKVKKERVMDSKSWTVRSHSDKKKTYVVTYDGKKWSCTCPVMQFETAPECKHIKEKKKDIKR